MKPNSVLESNTTYKGHILEVNVDKIMLPDGRSALREIVVRGNAAAVMPVDNEGNIIFVRQYRHATRQEVLEIPAGVIDEGEEAEACALRELEEETGYIAKDIKFITSNYTAIGFCTEKIYIYLAQNLEQGVQKLDKDEFVEVEKYSYEEALKMVFSGEIIDSKTIIAILSYKHFIK